MWLSKAADSLNRIIRPVSGSLYSVGLVALVALMFLTMADVILRYVFTMPITGSFDLTELLMVILIVFGVAHCGFIREHVKVDLVLARFPKRVQAIIDSVTAFLGFGLFVMISWQSFVYVKILIDSGLATNILKIPMFPFVGLVGLGSAVYTLILLVHFLESLSEAVKR